jgi:hypothetical protein
MLPTAGEPAFEPVGGILPAAADGVSTPVAGPAAVADPAGPAGATEVSDGTGGFVDVLQSIADALGAVGQTLGASPTNVVYGVVTAAIAALCVAAARVGPAAASLATCEGLPLRVVWRGLWESATSFSTGGGSAAAQALGGSGASGARSTKQGGADVSSRPGAVTPAKQPDPVQVEVLGAGPATLVAPARIGDAVLVALLAVSAFLLGLASLPARALRGIVLRYGSASVLIPYRTYLAAGGFAILFAVALMLIERA